MEAIAFIAPAGCTCTEATSRPEDALDCPVCGPSAAEFLQAEQESEIAAENAWLVHAERGTQDDYAFEQYESQLLGLYA